MATTRTRLKGGMVTMDYEIKGGFSTDNWLKKLLNLDWKSKLKKYGEEGVKALSSATPVDTGETADSWYYELKETNDSVSLEWKNSNKAGDTNIPVVILLVYGHADRSGVFVEGNDFVTPALKETLENLYKMMWKEIMNG